MVLLVQDAPIRKEPESALRIMEWPLVGREFSPVQHPDSREMMGEGCFCLFSYEKGRVSVSLLEMGMKQNKMGKSNWRINLARIAKHVQQLGFSEDSSQIAFRSSSLFPSNLVSSSIKNSPFPNFFNFVFY